MAKNSLALPDNLVQLLSAADRARGFPSGTMASLMTQEVGGQFDRFLADPAAAHYPTGVAPNGKKSSAFGPFGILESTARDPGYGVTPLRDKSIEEQLRFAADYLDARSRSAGSLSAGLAGYGEGERYSRQVVRRRDGGGVTQPVATAESVPSQITQPVVVADAGPAVVPQTPLTPAPADPEKDPWHQFQKRFEPAERPDQAMAYGSRPAGPAPAVARTPTNAMSSEEVAALYDIPLNARPSFGVFQGLSRLGRKA